MGPLRRGGRPERMPMARRRRGGCVRKNAAAARGFAEGEGHAGHCLDDGEAGEQVGRGERGARGCCCCAARPPAPCRRCGLRRRRRLLRPRGRGRGSSPRGGATATSSRLRPRPARIRIPGRHGLDLSEVVCPEVCREGPRNDVEDPESVGDHAVVVEEALDAVAEVGQEGVVVGRGSGRGGRRGGRSADAADGVSRQPGQRGRAGADGAGDRARIRW